MRSLRLLSSASSKLIRSNTVLRRASAIGVASRASFSTTNVAAHEQQQQQQQYAYNYFDNDWKRTHYCDRSVVDAVEQRVQLCGWVENIRELQTDKLIFLKLRDRMGSVQLVIDANKNPNLQSVVQAVKNTSIESVVSVSGIVQKRPENMVNKAMETGEVEVFLDTYRLLSKAEHLPFQLLNAEENIRLKYRYLDLRRPQLQRHLAMRSQALGLVKQYFGSLRFLEVETPTLFKSTPEGAREFLVPTRQRGKFYALTQSPQQYKQLLMIGGVDRYYQIARCYRDESGRLDRQPEFTQIDVEMSFITQEDIIATIEGLLKKLWKELIGVEITTPFMRMPYRVALERYGIDKPDLRLGMEFENFSDVFSGKSEVAFLKDKKHAYAFVARGLGAKASRKDLTELSDEAKKNGAQTFVTIKVQEDKKLSGSLAEQLSEHERKELQEKLNLQEGDLVVLSAGNDWEDTLIALGRARISCSQRMQQAGLMKLDPRDFKFLWVVDFPLFERSAEGQAGLFETTRDKGLASMHHPFTAPHPDDIKHLYSEPLKVRGLHYDVVLNGFEIGGGSIRIHDSKLQTYVLQDVLNLGPERTKERFSHLLEALSYGAPPHGGIALGFDRLMILLAQAINTENPGQQLSLRDVIAFPKSSTGNELMSNSPSAVEENQLKELHIQIRPEPTKAQ